MKGIAGSAGAVAVIAFRLFPGASGQSLRQEPAEQGLTGCVDAPGSPSMNTLDGSLSRRLQRRRRNQVVNDDALDVNGTRTEWAETEFTASHGTLHENSGDRSSAATFHKSLPHDSLGQVDSEAFDALTECIAEDDFDKCEQVPAGDADGFLVNPLGYLAVNMAGPAGHALAIPLLQRSTPRTWLLNWRNCAAIESKPPRSTQQEGNGNPSGLSNTQKGAVNKTSYNSSVDQGNIRSVKINI